MNSKVLSYAKPRFKIGQKVRLGSDDNAPTLEIKDIQRNGDGPYYYKFPGDEEGYSEDKLKLVPPAWNWTSLNDAYESDHSANYLVEEILLLPSLSSFYGQPGSLKTMLLMDLAICVSSNQNWLSGLPDQDIPGFQCTQGPVLWVDVENGKDVIHRRFKAIGKGHNAPGDSPLRFNSFPPFALNDKKAVEELRYAIEYYGAKLVVFDNLGAISGGVDENSSQMIGIMKTLREIAEDTFSAIVVIHHTTKQSDSLRGHSSINAAVDLALLVKRNKDQVILESTKTRHTPVQSFSAMWTYEPEDSELNSTRFFGLGKVKKGQPKDKVTIAESQIMNSLEDGTNQSKIIAMMNGKAGRDTVTNALNNLTASGKLSVKPGSNNSKEYYRT